MNIPPLGNEIVVRRNDEPMKEPMGCNADSRERPSYPNRVLPLLRGWNRSAALSAALALLGSAMYGCELDSFFDPSKTGRFMPEPTMIPILDRIDVIETDETLWGETTGVMPEDLHPNDLTYILAPGDFITVEVYDIRQVDVATVHARRIDATGNFRIAEIGDVRAAGWTVQEFEDHLAELLVRQLVIRPRVYVHVDESTAFTYTIHGHINAPGLFTLRKADMRLNEALASVGGVPSNVERIYVIRQVRLSEDLLPVYERDQSAPPRQRQDRPRTPVDIEDLIDELEDRPRTQPGMLGTITGEKPHRAGYTPSATTSSRSLGNAQPTRISDRPVDVDELRMIAGQPSIQPPVDETFVFIEETGEWVPIRRSQTLAPASEPRRPLTHPVDINDVTPPAPPIDVDDLSTPAPHIHDAERRQIENDAPRLVTERVIEIPYERLLTDSRFDIIVRPNDRIYVEGPRLGLVYISGEIARPGVYDMPHTGRLTLSRLVAAAGDLGPLAMPERVDLTRMVGPDREATLRLNLAAIRRRTEPDIIIKPNDHIIIGTSWVSTPLAVIRNGFRATYGFGFLLDRNFGNDVFGAPPGSRGF